MNRRQTEAFNQAFTNCLTLIQGPPGTGKTATAAWIVDAFAEQESRILLSSGANAAIDNVCAKTDAATTKKLTRYIADSVEEKVDSLVRKRYANRMFPKEAEKMLLGWGYKRSAKHWPSHLKKQCMEELQKYQIVAMTLHKLGELANNVRTQRKSNHQPLNPDMVIVEEAS